ncbi:MAG: FAD-binding oxidoreductase, partial [Candidatus Bathyarchaeia archaeon]
MKEIVESLKAIVGEENIFVDCEISEEYSHDEALTVKPRLPDILVKPSTTKEVSEVLKFVNEKKIPVTPRGSGTGLSGGCVPIFGGILLSLERMNKILEIDEENHIAVVEAGVILNDLYKAVEARGLYYPIYPGEGTATIGGNIATNAGGMMAVKYGVTRHFVLGLEAVLPTGEIIQTGGKYVKSSTGYDLTQLLVGSEGTLAVITKAVLKLLPRPKAKTTLFVAFKNLYDGVKAVPAILKTGKTPLIIEFLEKISLTSMENYTGIRVSIEEQIREQAEAFLLIVLEGESAAETYREAELISEVCTKNGAIGMFIPPTERAGRELLELREKAFYAAKDAGATELMDVVVPRSEIHEFMMQVHKISEKYGV